MSVRVYTLATLTITRLVLMRLVFFSLSSPKSLKHEPLTSALLFRGVDDILCNLGSVGVPDSGSLSQPWFNLVRTDFKNHGLLPLFCNIRPSTLYKVVIATGL